jgi:hypothetical protein
MTAEEAIEFIEVAANLHAAMDADIFSTRVREDLSIFRRHAETPTIERSVDRDVEYPPFRPEFSVPERYREDPELWVVFSAFVSCFVDPIEFGVSALNSFRESLGHSEIERVAIVSETRQEEDADEMEILDLETLTRNRHELIEIADEIGRGLFGSDFDVRDFVGDENG